MAGIPMSTGNFDQPVNCSASRAVKSIFGGPNWISNLLWLTIAVLLQSFVVGSIFLFGYGASLLQARAGLPDRKSPDIDSNRLGDYFMQGLWPFLVNLVASMIVAIIVAIPFLSFFTILLVVASQLGDMGEVLVAVLVFPLVIAMMLLMMMLIGTITIRAMICQDFQKSFDIAWCVSFIRLTFKEAVLSALTLMAMGIGIYLVGTAMFCVGIVPAAGLLSGAAMHLLAQWYELFLSRGGEPVEPASGAIVDAHLIGPNGRP
jgi:hypothetical protein